MPVLADANAPKSAPAMMPGKVDILRKCFPFMGKELFLEIGNGTQSLILRRIKENSGMTWCKIAKIMKVDRSMVFQYLGETSRLPFYRLTKLCKETGYDRRKFGGIRRVYLVCNGKKEILKPKLDEELSEFLGAMAGDGNIYWKNYAITITCSAVVDYNYAAEIIRNKFQKLFGLMPKIRIFGNAVQCRAYSKSLATFLNRKFEFPVGNRKNRMFIPGKIAGNKKFLIAYLRGLFDTDGSFHRKRERSGVVEYISCSKGFLQQIREALESLGFSICLSGKSAYIYGQKQVEMFFKVIKPNNSKHCIKFRVFKETGKVPANAEFIKATVV